jgi:D-methionine transport system substrate-binding protein
MKKKSILSVVLAGIVAVGLVGCGGATNTGSAGSADSKNDKVIKIGVTPKPHEEIVNIAKPLLEKEGYTVEITEFNDYNQPNHAVEEVSLVENC